MLQVSPQAQVKYKRRKVSAIRHFPLGCVPNAVKVDAKPVEGTLSPVALENGKITHADSVSVASNAVDKPADPSPPVLVEEALNSSSSSKALVPDVVEPPAIGSTISLLENNTGSNSETVKQEVQVVMDDISVLEKNVESISETEKLEVHHASENNNTERVKVEVQQVVMESSEPGILPSRHHLLKMYVPPRRRKVSAVRNFPPGCGPAFAARTSLRDNSLVREKLNEASKHLVSNGSVNVVDGEFVGIEMRSNYSKEVVKQIDEGISGEPIVGAVISSPKANSLQQEMVGGSTLVTSTKKLLHAKENVLSVRQSTPMDDSTQILDAENTLNREKPTMRRATTVGGPVKASSSGRFGAVERKDSRLTDGKELVVFDGAMVRSNSDKNFKVQGYSGHGQVKSSLKGGLKGKSLLRGESNERLVRSSSDKALEVHKVRTVQNIQTKANASCPSSSVVKSLSGSKGLDKSGVLLMDEHIGKANEVGQKSSKKRNLPAEIPYKGYNPAEGDESLDAIGERMIVQSLMASKNCPWRNLLKRSAISSDSFITKNKTRKEKRFVDKTPGSKNYFSSQNKIKEPIDDDDDDNILEEDNELSLTMTPFIPHESNQKGGDNEEVAARHKVKRALRLFQLICRKLLQGEESGSKKVGKRRIDLNASAILKDSGEWVNGGDPIVGHVPGVEIGDEFHFRVELSIVGLHRPFQGGIDCTKKNGILLATSIVASGGYQDDMDSSDVLIYSGSGGTSVVGGDKQQGDQKLERGNLALKNSIDAQTPVRVIHGFKEKGSDSNDAKNKLVSTFTYDGLYLVESYWQEIGSSGFNVFKFQLRRMAQQPELPFKELKRSAKLKVREGLCVKDISQGKEKMAISVINTIDIDQPMPFKYITKSIYPSWYAKTPPSGCNCTNGCSDSDRCACAVKNGGEIPFNYNGAIVQAKPLIYECGPSCKCSSSCHNRISQRGIRVQLEIFKTRGRGWGVRSLKSIPSGTFICEYVGELLQDADAEQRINDEYLFDIGHNYDDRSLWAGLPNFIPGLLSSSHCDTVENVGFTIDAAEYGNVGRFINHSCSPNLYAQNVLYDHDDKRMPHIMFFAVDNIPPLQELTYHYNYTIDEVRDSEGNIKQKACHCGSPECCGRLY